MGKGLRRFFLPAGAGAAAGVPCGRRETVAGGVIEAGPVFAAPAKRGQSFLQLLCSMKLLSSHRWLRPVAALIAAILGGGGAFCPAADAPPPIEGRWAGTLTISPNHWEVGLEFKRDEKNQLMG